METAAVLPLPGQNKRSSTGWLAVVLSADVLGLPLCSVFCVHMEQPVLPRTCSREQAPESRASGVAHWDISCKQCELRGAVTACTAPGRSHLMQNEGGQYLCQLDLTPSSDAKQTPRCLHHLPASEMGMVLHLVKVICIFRTWL